MLFGALLKATNASLITLAALFRPQYHANTNKAQMHVNTNFVPNHLYDINQWHDIFYLSFPYFMSLL